ncbi:BatA domain-containing protein [Hufsiella ginkgonis]|uniref:Aerotolerance regulator N-terminal domain-containing protein n=1 Tax=Hufsiella ginkgonis TaxID=2695274 RepID=A0A7K1Y1S9_9SPHI|nr:BatA domain-containing protein [Hufsiella ginkgonis]MXV17210.1 hypothetical protein [Hufsiella ginkgonis]
MLQLLNPIWLFSLLTLAVPVVIHLWNIKQGKTLKIGSIALLGESSRQNAKSLQLSDLLLLILRCLLLAGLALLLCQPVWRDEKPVASRGWVLIEQAGARETYHHFKKSIDSLVNAGHELHYFGPGFRKAKLDEINADTLPASADSARLSYWALLHLLESKLPPRKPVTLFTVNQARRISGKRPSVSFPVTWRTYIPADSTVTWLQDAFLTSSDSVIVTLGKSTPAANTFKNYTIRPTGDHPLFGYSIINGQPLIILKGKNARVADSILVDTAATHIEIDSHRYPQDGPYVRAAIEAIKSYTGRKIIYSRANNKTDWVFFLSDIPNENHRSNKTNVLLYSGGDGSPAGTTTGSLNSEVITAAHHEKIALLKRTPANDPGNKDEVIWKDGAGDPLLVKTNTENTTYYQFYSHFNPAWNDLVWSSSFPMILMDLMFKNKPVPHEIDHRALPDEQYLPVNSKTAASGGKINAGDATPLTNYIWLFLFLLFAIERMITYKQQTETSYAGK